MHSGLLQKQVLPGRGRRVEQLHLTRAEFTIQNFIQKFLALALILLAAQLDLQTEFKEVESHFYFVYRKVNFEVSKLKKKSTIQNHHKLKSNRSRSFTTGWPDTSTWRSFPAVFCEKRNNPTEC